MGRKGVRFDTKVPMRYTVKSLHAKTPEAKKATITNMSSTGIRFETEEQLGAGVIITVEILLPKNIVVEAAGKIVKVKPIQKEEGRYYEAALTFTEISGTAREEINMWYYSQRLSPGIETANIEETERRKSERFKVGRAFVEYRKKQLLPKEQWKQAEIKQVSKHGISLTVRAFAKEGEVWEIMLHLPAYREPIKAVVKVIKVRRESAGLSSDVGLEFMKIKESGRKKLSESAYIKELIDKSDSELR
jgi:c-di-GMP-binding flagellar brake protein YcgR